jgi:hypothetical protein
MVIIASYRWSTTAREGAGPLADLDERPQFAVRPVAGDLVLMLADAALDPAER